jgi:hypothetical protein
MNRNMQDNTEEYDYNICVPIETWVNVSITRDKPNLTLKEFTDWDGKDCLTEDEIFHCSQDPICYSDWNVEATFEDKERWEFYG